MSRNVLYRLWGGGGGGRQKRCTRDWWKEKAKVVQPAKLHRLHMKSELYHNLTFTNAMFSKQQHAFLWHGKACEVVAVLQAKQWKMIQREQESERDRENTGRIYLLVKHMSLKSKVWSAVKQKEAEKFSNSDSSERKPKVGLLGVKWPLFSKS